MEKTRFSQRETINGRYEILGEIGGGSYGTVYRVADLHAGGMILAAKGVYDGSGDKEAQVEAVEFLRKEFSILTELCHPCIPQIFEYCVSGRSHFIIMELIEGETLQERLEKRGRAFSHQEVVGWALQIADTLSYLHAQKPYPVILRDLKPSNVMVTPGDVIKLIDFGIARHFLSHKTRDTDFLGTPGYAAPEQYGNGQSEVRTDIFSLGATLYFLLTFEDMAKLQFRHPPLRMLEPNVPRELERIVMQCLKRNPGERYQSAEALRKDLLSLYRQMGGAVIQSKRAAPSRLSRQLTTILASLFCLCVALPITHCIKDHQSKGMLDACSNNMKNMGSALELYSTDNYGRYPRNLSQISPAYLKDLPCCPAAGKFTYSYESTVVPDIYTLTCVGQNHREKLGEMNPSYSSMQGLIEP